MEFYNSEFKSIRKKRGLTLEKLAALMGISQRTLSSWERAERSPGQSDIRIMAQILMVNVNQISDLEEFDLSLMPYYYEQLNPLDAIDVDFDKGGANLTAKEYILKLKRSIETLTNEKKQLKLENIKFKIILEYIKLFIYTKDENLNFTYANTSFLAYLNCSKESLLGKNNYSLYGKDEISSVTELEKRVLKGEQIINSEIVIPGSKGKKTGVFSGSPIINYSTGEICGIVVGIKDLTEEFLVRDRLKMIETVINESDAFYWIAVLKPIPHYLYISEGIYRVSGLSVDEMHKDPEIWRSIIHPDDIHKADYVRYNPKGYTEYRIYVDGKIKWISNRFYTIKAEKFKGIRFGIVRDITGERCSRKRNLGNY